MNRRGAALLIVVAALAGVGLPFARSKALPLDRWAPESGLTPQFVTVTVRSRPLKLRYIRSGAGEPIILLHGLGSSIATFRKILPDLAKDHDVAAVDLPGFGGSEIPEPMDLAVLPEAVLAFAERLGFSRAIWLGNSLGGGVALWIAAEDGARVSRLILVDSVGFRLDPSDWPRTVRLSVALTPVVAVLPMKRLLVAHALREVFYDPRFVTREEVDDHLAPLQRRGAFAAARDILVSVAGQAARVHEAISRVSVPTLVLWGKEDRWIPASDAGRFVQEIPGARAVVFDRCGHVPQEECPEETLAAIRQFLNDPGTGRD